MKSTLKNIPLLYILNATYYSWFWLGVWVFYYVKFGGFSAVGILETVMIVSTILFEIPTGAIGDLLGKKKTLFIAYILAGISNLWMGIASSIWHLVFALIVMNLGGALRSGTFEAMIYDSLKQQKEEKQYRSVLSKMTAIRLATLAVVSIIGGFLYKISPGLPFILCGIIILASSIVTLFLVEPAIDTEKFTMKNYLKQNILGFKQLFAKGAIRQRSIALLLVLVVTLIMYEGLNDILSISFGFTEIQLGFFAAVLSLLGAWASVFSEKIVKKYSSRVLYFWSLLFYALSLVISPFVGLILGGLTIVVRNILTPILENESSALLNESIDSQYRATALSTFSMLKSLPYAVLIYPVTAMAEVIPVVQVALVLGICTLFIWLFNLQVIPD